MPQSLSLIFVHLIFSTKNREPWISPALERELHPYMATIFRELKSPSLAINGTSDHLHILFSLGRVIAVADLVEEIKTGTSKWVKTKGREFMNFHWQRGYGAFSVEQSDIPEVKHYIQNQKERDRSISFQDEYRSFLEGYGIEYDERYVWD